MAYMAARLVRLRPVVLERYRLVKRAHGTLDQLDLLIALRDVLQRDLESRAFYQARFDHIMVDEFQDTDPLQAEIVMYLCEDGARAQTPAQIQLAAGKLTVVGDPKQSIYRFRRADIAMYAAVCERIRQGPVCQAQITVNFRSATSILDWLNQGFDAVLGSGDGPVLDQERGSVRNVRLAPSGTPDANAGVHVVPSGNSELKAEESRDVEGRALAHYIRHLVEDAQVQIRDPRSGELRKPHYGDVAVMMIATQTVHHLTSELDRLGVPHVVRGGTLFMQDALHQQFVLGLRALSDRADGVARAALMRPPFFAVTLEDLTRQRLQQVTTPALLQADELFTALRRVRHQLTPGEMARRVLETTGFGRYVAAGVNGPQRLARLYELCLYLDDIARELKLDFDGVTQIARTWIEAPARIEAPLPIDSDAVQVITAHQAKGLEWPIVALWDGRASWRAYLPQVAFAVDATSGEWALKLDGLAYDPTERELQQRETDLRAEERKRVVYVAATRARSILIVPEAGDPKDTTIAGKLLGCTRDRPAQRVPHFEADGEAWWHSARGVSLRPLPAMRDELDAQWSAAAASALVARLSPAGVSGVAHAVRAAAVDEEPSVARAPREGRYGARFGSAVHRALELRLTQQTADDAAAAERAAREYGYDNLALVTADVANAMSALGVANLLSHASRSEYAIAGTLEPGTLVAGYIDLLVATTDAITIIDYKTDMPPRGAVERAYPAYAAQVRAYAELIEKSGIAEQRSIRSALLFTADGSLHWL
jgi:ATP-dependent helicase/nuclease subunit A